MTPDLYLNSVLGRISGPTGASGPGERVKRALHQTIQEWAGNRLLDVVLSGSYAKGTNIVGGTDVDLFISLSDAGDETLKQIYQMLAVFMTEKGVAVRQQNVAIGVTLDGLKVDLVPGRKQNATTTDHSIYISRQDTWHKTNVQTHVSVIGGSGYTDVMRLLKYWRKLHNLDFPSFAAELTVLKAFEGIVVSGLAAQLHAVLKFLCDRLSGAALNDPANASNNVASEITSSEKLAISSQAGASLREPFWEQVIW